jgi:hypothetical protein
VEMPLPELRILKRLDKDIVFSLFVVCDRTTSPGQTFLYRGGICKPGVARLVKLSDAHPQDDTVGARFWRCWQNRFLNCRRHW